MRRSEWALELDEINENYLVNFYVLPLDLSSVKMDIVMVRVCRIDHFSCSKTT